MPMRVLVAYSMTSTYVQTTRDYLEAFRKWPDCTVDFVHVTHGAKIGFDLDEYDVIVNSYCARLCFKDYVSDDYIGKLRKFGGVKILSVQDEYDHTNELKKAIRSIRFDLVLTCVPQDSVERVYPASEFPGVTFKTVLTGYVPTSLGGTPDQIRPLCERPIVVGYRGRDIGPRYGQLAYDKFRIGPSVRAYCQEHGVPHDIDVTEASRIYGPAWMEFIASCRTMLGTESGSNVFDFDGSLQREYEKRTVELGRQPTYEEFLPVVASREGLVQMGQVSPRVFECAVQRTAMILFEGRYSDAIRPGEHYIALKKDLSNLAEVIEIAGNTDLLEAMVERAHTHLIASGSFSYERFARDLEAEARQVLARKKWRARRGTMLGARPNVLAETPTKEPLSATEYERSFRSRTAAAELLGRRTFKLEMTVQCRAMRMRLDAILKLLARFDVADGEIDGAGRRLLADLTELGAKIDACSLDPSPAEAEHVGAGCPWQTLRDRQVDVFQRLQDLKVQYGHLVGRAVAGLRASPKGYLGLGTARLEFDLARSVRLVTAGEKLIRSGFRAEQMALDWADHLRKHFA